MSHIYSGTKPDQTKETMQIKLITPTIEARSIEIHPEWKSIIPEGESGDCRIQRFDVTKDGAAIHNLRVLNHRMNSDHFINPGTYTRLLIGGHTMMSDTQKEFIDHQEMFGMCAGNVLIMGLGLGCAASVVASMPHVNRVTVVEISEHVIRLVAPTLKERFKHKIDIIHADAFTWPLPKDVTYGVGWFDIWLEISDRNLPEMGKLKRRFSKRCNWMGCWSEPEARKLKRIVDRMRRDGYDID